MIFTFGLALFGLVISISILAGFFGGSLGGGFKVILGYVGFLGICLMSLSLGLALFHWAARTLP